MTDCDLELAILLSKVGVRPGAVLFGETVSHLAAYVGGYAEAQDGLEADRTVLCGGLLERFGEWLVEEHSAVGSDWYWRVCSLDSGERNVQLMLRLFRDYLLTIGRPIPEDIALEYCFGRISMSHAKAAVRLAWAEGAK